MVYTGQNDHCSWYIKSEHFLPGPFGRGGYAVKDWAAAAKLEVPRGCSSASLNDNFFDLGLVRKFAACCIQAASAQDRDSNPVRERLSHAACAQTLSVGQWLDCSGVTIRTIRIDPTVASSNSNEI
jgi:hypothetical protein